LPLAEPLCLSGGDIGRSNYFCQHKPRLQDSQLELQMHNMTGWEYNPYIHTGMEDTVMQQLPVFTSAIDRK
jgi:hypothetical protein